MTDPPRGTGYRRTGFLGTTRPDGRPHAAGIGSVWFDGDLYFTSGAGTRKAGNLAANPACTISTRLEGIDFVLEGEATRVSDRPTLEQAAAVYREGDLAMPSTITDPASVAMSPTLLRCQPCVVS